MTVSKIKQKINVNVKNSAEVKNLGFHRPIYLSLNESYTSRFKCALRLLSMYLRKYEWIKKMYFRIKK